MTDRYRGMIRKNKNGRKIWGWGKYWYFVEIRGDWIDLGNIQKQCDCETFFGKEYKNWYLQLVDDLSMGNTDPFIFHFRYKKDLTLFKKMTKL